MSQNNPAEFIDRLEQFGVTNGLSRSVARVLGYLIICEPTKQSATEIQHAVHLSSGSVSSALNILRGIGFIARHQSKSERRFYYEIDSDGWKQATILQLQSMGRWVELAEFGLESSPRNPRLIMMRDIYTRFDQEFADIARRLGA